MMWPDIKTDVSNWYGSRWHYCGK